MLCQNIYSKMAILPHIRAAREMLDAASKKPSGKKRIYSFENDKAGYLNARLGKILEEITQEAFLLGTHHRKDPGKRGAALRMLNLLAENPLESLQELESLCLQLGSVPDAGIRLAVPKNLPSEIAGAVAADIRELQKTYNSGCYRAATIICGRIIEVLLHRKYYDCTGTDILEKNPGIGLGKLIAKLSEKSVPLDPGLNQQIHLVNQIRIHSVHAKKESFEPTARQAYAIILYTMDIMEKLF